MGGESGGGKCQGGWQMESDMRGLESDRRGLADAMEDESIKKVIGRRNVTEARWKVTRRGLGDEK